MIRGFVISSGCVIEALGRMEYLDIDIASAVCSLISLLLLHRGNQRSEGQRLPFSDQLRSKC